MSKQFTRQETNRHLRLGRTRKKYRKWRRPIGRDSKMRQKRKSYPSSPMVGNRSPRKESGKIQGLTPVLVHNMKELHNLQKNQIAILAKIGAKKKLEIIKVAQEKKIQLLNVKENKR